MQTIHILVDKDTDEAAMYGENPVFGPFVSTTPQVELPAHLHRRETFTNEISIPIFLKHVCQDFGPVYTDVLFVNGTPLPNSLDGARWVDAHNKTQFWTALFQIEELGRKATQEAIAQMLKVSPETLEAIQDIAEDKDDESALSALIQEKVWMQVKPEVGSINYGTTPDGSYIVGNSTLFRITTEGLAAFQKPELEHTHVPMWWIKSAIDDLHTWALLSLRYGLTPGVTHTSNIGKTLQFQIEAVPSTEPQWKGHPTGCLQIQIVKALLQPSQTPEPPMHN